MANIFQNFVWLFLYSFLILCHLSLLVCRDIKDPHSQRCPNRPRVLDLIDDYLFSVPLLKQNVVMLIKNMNIPVQQFEYMSVIGIPVIFAENLFVFYYAIMIPFWILKELIRNLVIIAVIIAFAVGIFAFLGGNYDFSVHLEDLKGLLNKFTEISLMLYAEVKEEIGSKRFYN